MSELIEKLKEELSDCSEWANLYKHERDFWKYISERIMNEEKCKHKYITPRKLLAAWTAENYQGACPMYVNITQIGSMGEVTIRTPEVEGQQQTITFQVNYWTLAKIAEIFKESAFGKKIEADGVCEKCGHEWHTDF